MIMVFIVISFLIMNKCLLILYFFPIEVFVKIVYAWGQNRVRENSHNYAHFYVGMNIKM